MSLPLDISKALRWIVCPACRQSLELVSSGLRCTGCARCYTIIDDLPILIIERNKSH